MNIQKKNSRRYIEPGPKLHTVELQRGLALGYRKTGQSATWTARRFIVGTKYEFCVLATADDGQLQADGVNVLNFDQAAEKARQWARTAALKEAGEILPGAYSVSKCLDDYFDDLKMRKEGDHSQTQSTIEAKIKPALGEIQLQKLRRAHIEDWFHKLVKDGNSKATANRNFTVLSAALNFAYRKDRIGNKAIWDKIQKFKGANNAKVRYLTVDECKRLIDVCSPDFRALVRAALYTGARYGEIIAMRVSDFNADNNTIHIPKSKSGKPRTIPLTPEALAFFTGVISGKDKHDLLFAHTVGRHKGEPWQRTQQTFHMKVACKAAKIKPAIGFHILRHSVASHLKMQRADSLVVARLLGHTTTRMVELHYSHLDDNYIATEIRAKLPNLAGL
jgi:integrase